MHALGGFGRIDTQLFGQGGPAPAVRVQCSCGISGSHLGLHERTPRVLAQRRLVDGLGQHGASLGVQSESAAHDPQGDQHVDQPIVGSFSHCVQPGAVRPGNDGTRQHGARPVGEVTGVFESIPVRGLGGRSRPVHRLFEVDPDVVQFDPVGAADGGDRQSMGARGREAHGAPC